MSDVTRLPENRLTIHDRNLIERHSEVAGGISRRMATQLFNEIDRLRAVLAEYQATWHIAHGHGYPPADCRWSTCEAIREGLRTAADPVLTPDEFAAHIIATRPDVREAALAILREADARTAQPSAEGGSK